MEPKKALTTTGCIFAVLGIIFAGVAVALMTIYFYKGQIRDKKVEPPPEVIIEDIQDTDESSNAAVDN